MATTLVQAPFPLPYVLPPIPRTTNMVKIHRLIPATHSWAKRARFGDCPSGFIPIQSSGLVGDAEEIKEKEQELLEYKTLAQIKTELCLAVQGINRGIFGSPTAKKSEIEGLVKLLESQNPTPDPTSNLEKVNGCWKLVYSTITILGSKRTKLGLRDFISLGDFLQIIDVAKRVNINYDNSTITPDQLMNMFRKNYDILLSIFNPEGWLEITYVDDSMRIGRDDKDNIFLLERSEENEI